MYQPPFRWNIQKRNELGSLLDGPEAATIPGLLDELLPCCARIIGFSGDSDLFFVGRSPESIFDHLSGLLLDSSWAERPRLLQFSMRYWFNPGMQLNRDKARAGIRAYFSYLGLQPAALARRPRPVALVDLVASGGTFKNLVTLLHEWAEETGADWDAARRKIRIVGITQREKQGPNAWRWQQHADWLSLLERGAVKNVSVSPAPLVLSRQYAGESHRPLHTLALGQRRGHPSILYRRKPRSLAPGREALRRRARQRAPRRLCPRDGSGASDGAVLVSGAGPRTLSDNVSTRKYVIVYVIRLIPFRALPDTLCAMSGPPTRGTKGSKHMEDTSPAPSTVSEPATSEPIVTSPRPADPQPPAPRRVKPLLLGLLAGFAPALLTPLYYLISSLEEAFHTLYFFTFWDWLILLLGLYGVAWVGAIILRLVSKQHSRRAFANGMLIALGLTVALLCSALGLLILTVQTWA